MNPVKDNTLHFFNLTLDLEGPPKWSYDEGMGSDVGASVQWEKDGPNEHWVAECRLDHKRFSLKRYGSHGPQAALEDLESDVVGAVSDARTLLKTAAELGVTSEMS